MEIRPPVIHSFHRLFTFLCCFMHTLSQSDVQTAQRIQAFFYTPASGQILHFGNDVKKTHNCGKNPLYIYKTIRCGAAAKEEEKEYK